MRIKLNGNVTKASEPTCGRKTLDGMLLSNLSNFGEEPLFQDFPQDFSPEQNEAMPMFETFSQVNEEQMEPTQISCWHIGEELEASFNASQDFSPVDDFSTTQFEETFEQQGGIDQYPEWVDQLEVTDFAPSEQNEVVEEYTSDSPFIAPHHEGAPISSEVFRSKRGTIEFVQHESGTYVRPTYNKCGMLVRVDFNGMSLYKKSTDALWQMVDENEREIAPSQIKTVYFERNGDLVSQTVNGTKVVILTNGSLTTA